MCTTGIDVGWDVVEWNYMNKMNEYNEEFWSHFEVVGDEITQQYQSLPCQITKFQQECIKTALFNAGCYLALPDEKPTVNESSTFHIGAGVNFK